MTQNEFLNEFIKLMSVIWNQSVKQMKHAQEVQAIYYNCDGVESDMTAPSPAAHWLSKIRRNAVYARQFTTKPQWLPKERPTDQWRW